MTEQIAKTYFEQLLSKDLSSRKSAIFGIKHYLETIKTDSFVKIMLDLDIHHLLQNLLIKSDYSFSLDILKCFEHLCSYKIYFTSDFAVETSEIILKNFMKLDTDHKFDNVVVESLKIITIIIENLDDYYSRNNLLFDRYLVTARNFLINKNNAMVICAIIKMFSALLLHEKFQKHINNDIFPEIEIIWNLSLQKLADIFDTDSRNSVTGVSKLCESILRMLMKLLTYKKKEIETMFERVQNISVNCLKRVCIPYIAEFGLSNEICLEYLCFLKTMLKSNLAKDVLAIISQQLVTDLNFTVITKYLDFSASIPNFEEQEQMRQLCLMILCEIIVNFSDPSSCVFNEEKCKKYLFKNLEGIVQSKVNEWLNFLSNKISIDTKLVIIKFCTMYYFHSNNLYEIQPSHINAFIDFLRNFPSSMNVDIYFLKDLWLFFAVICCSNTTEIQDDFALNKATCTLQRLILVNEKSFDKILTYHPSIICWIFINPFVKEKLLHAVMNSWLLRSQINSEARSALLYIISNCNKAASLVLKILEDSPKYSAASADILRAALISGPLSNNQEFAQQISIAVPYAINNLGQEIYNDRVVTCIYMMHLSTYVKTPVDKNLLDYSVQTIVGFIGANGLSDMLPVVFYTNAFDYTNNILEVAKSNQINQVVQTLMNSEPMLCTLMTALVSDNQELSVKASQIFKNLLEYQTYHRLYCKNTLLIKKDYLIKLMCVSNEELLELNIQIIKILLFKTSKCLLDLEIDDNILKGLYFRCLNLVSKPGNHKLSNFSIKCLEGILKYSYFHKLSCHEYLCHHTANHNMILIFFDKETSKPINRTFLSFIQCWLQFSLKNNTQVYNKLSITRTFWTMTLYQIADLILGNTVENQSENIILKNNILKMLLQFMDLLPAPLANYLRGIEENLNKGK